MKGREIRAELWRNELTVTASLLIALAMFFLALMHRGSH